MYASRKSEETDPSGQSQQNSSADIARTYIIHGMRNKRALVKADIPAQLHQNVDQENEISQILSRLTFAVCRDLNRPSRILARPSAVRVASWLSRQNMLFLFNSDEVDDF